jgi:hypothetical protein
LCGAKVKNWKYKIENTPATATLAFVGDSTSDFTGNGSGLPANINAKTKIGFPLEGFNIANMPITVLMVKPLDLLVTQV